MALRIRTAACLIASHIATTTEPTERPVTRAPYRTRRRMAAALRLAFLLLVAAAFWLGAR
ncbi:hypothetical protein ABE488_00885 [Luteimonas sp. TWI662]|uniref:hypothetical protein n=1 Tax=Luteimonas sp. TWI662 TaxID=3136789 RepID=UPI003207C058